MTFPGLPQDLSTTTARPMATFSRPPWGLLRAFRGLFRDLSGRGQKRKKARKVVKTQRILTIMVRIESPGHGASGSGVPGAQNGPNRAQNCPKPGGSWSAIFCALSTTFPGDPPDLSRTSGRPLATFSRPPRGLLGPFGGLFWDLFGTGQKRKRARKVVKSHRIGTKMVRIESSGHGASDSGVPGARRGQQRAQKGQNWFPGKSEKSWFFGIAKKMDLRAPG